MIGFVLCKFVPGLEQKTLSHIRGVKGMKEVHLTFGRWDALLMVEANSLDNLSSTVLRDIRGVQGVADTETLVTTSV